VQPSNIEICEYETAVFTATVSNANSYQWQVYDGTTWGDLTDVNPYSNTATSSLSITSPSTSINNTSYRLISSSSIASCAD
ncbi:hypothetical protein J9332_44550, partial [Aquimarina celericrescens]|nr:hypothetical protein [Aquimarina celericrescens]